MERALSGALRGVAPEPTAATRVLGDADATRRLDRTSVTDAARPHAGRARPPPADGADRRAAPARQAAGRPARRGARPPAPPRSGGALRLLRNVLLLALLAAVAVGAYVIVTESSQRGVRLKEQVEGNVDRAVQEIQDLISDNTQ